MQTYKNIDEYIKKASKEHQETLKTVRTLVNTVVPKGEEVIRYGMPTIQIGGKNLIHYAAMKGHFGFYPAPTGVDAFIADLEKAGIEYSKGCIRFPYNKPLPVALIKKIITFRVKESKSKS